MEMKRIVQVKTYSSLNVVCNLVKEIFTFFFSDFLTAKNSESLSTDPILYSKVILDRNNRLF